MRRLIATLFGMACSFGGFADETNVFKIVTENFPPYNYEEEGIQKGVSTEIVKALLQNLKLNDAKIKTLPWSRAYNHALSEKNVLIYSIARIPEREALFHWVGKLVTYRTSLYKLRDNYLPKISRLEDAKSYVIGTSTDDVITIYLEKKGFTNLETVALDQQNIHRLLLGRVDMIAYDEASFIYRVQSEGLDLGRFERVFRIEDLSDDLYIALSSKSDLEMVSRFQRAHEDIEAQGIIKRIQQKYLLMP